VFFAIFPLQPASVQSIATETDRRNSRIFREFLRGCMGGRGSMNPHNLNPNPNLNLSVSLPPPVKPRRTQSQSVAVINQPERIRNPHPLANHSPDEFLCPIRVHPVPSVVKASPSGQRVKPSQSASKRCRRSNWWQIMCKHLNINCLRNKPLLAESNSVKVSQTCFISFDQPARNPA
jgi:hypothetical protein